MLIAVGTDRILTADIQDILRAGDQVGSIIGGALALIGSAYWIWRRFRIFRRSHRTNLLQPEFRKEDGSLFVHLLLSVENDDDSVSVWIRNISGVSKVNKPPTEGWNAPRRDLTLTQQDYKQYRRRENRWNIVEVVDHQKVRCFSASLPSGWELFYADDREGVVLDIEINTARNGAIRVRFVLVRPSNESPTVRFSYHLVERLSPYKLEKTGFSTTPLADLAKEQGEL